MSDIFSRQRGLVHQEKVESLKVTFEEEASIPQALKHSMKQLADQLGVKNFPSESEGSEFTLSWVHEVNRFRMETRPINDFCILWPRRRISRRHTLRKARSSDF